MKDFIAQPKTPQAASRHKTSKQPADFSKDLSTNTGASHLKERLEDLYTSYHSNYLYSDPLKYLHQYSRTEDVEIVGIIASSLAYGRVEKIFESIEQILRIMGPHPADYILSFDPKKDFVKFKNFVHRFNKGEDISCLIYFLQQILDNFGSIGEFFKKCYYQSGGDIKETLSAFTQNILSFNTADFYGGGKLPDRAGVRYFFPSPAKGSPCKRLNLYLRWMVRKSDGIDFGLWDFVDPSRLIIPVDTHIARLSRYLGLTNKKNPSWKVAVEITEKFKEINPVDPLRYDFSLCRLGILDICPSKVDKKICFECGIKDICIL